MEIFLERQRELGQFDGTVSVNYEDEGSDEEEVLSPYNLFSNQPSPKKIEPTLKKVKAKMKQQYKGDTSTSEREVVPIIKSNSFGAADDLLDQFEDLRLEEAVQIDFPGDTVFIDVHDDQVEEASVKLVKVKSTIGYHKKVEEEKQSCAEIIKGGGDRDAYWRKRKSEIKS